MIKQELEDAIQETQEKIYLLKSKLQDDQFWSERRRLLKQIKELQYLQLWQIELLYRS